MSNEVAELVEEGAAPEPVRAEPIVNRFLFVDVAARRAKQLRRGARPRLNPPPEPPVKLERVAMREVELGLIDYTLPSPKNPDLPGSKSQG